MQTVHNDLQRALFDDRRVFYCSYSDTIRQAPQNYLLCLRHNGKFSATPDKASPLNAHSLNIVLKENENLDKEELAAAIELAFWGKR